MHFELLSPNSISNLQLGHYLFAHSKVVDHDQAEASKAHVEVERARAEADYLRVTSKVQIVEVEHL